MIVCSCNVITDQDIKSAVLKLRSSGEGSLLTIAQVYKALGCRPQCGSCLDHAIQIMMNDMA